MISFFRTTFILLALVITKQASAQYKDLLEIQTIQQIKKFRQLGVKIEFITSDNAEDKNYEASYIDTAGRKTLIQFPKSKSYMVYDEKGRLTRKLDSIQTKDSLVTREYYVLYGNHGYPSMIQGPGFTAVFKYDEKNRELEEYYRPFTGEEHSKIYKYDVKGKILQEEHKTKSGEIFKLQKFEYDINGTLVKETITETMPDDSRTFFGITYAYDKKSRLASKEVITIQNYPGERPDPTVKRVPKYRTNKVSYTYDDKGNLIKEVMKDLNNERGSYTITMTYDSNGLLTDYVSVDYKNRPLLGLIYNYEYRNNKK